MKLLVVSGAVVLATIFGEVRAHAEIPIGNYQLLIPSRYDFHTWIWAVTPGPDGACPPGCLHIAGLPQPTAKASYYQGNARRLGDKYVLEIDDPFGLRCGNIYYGPTIPTHDIYTWDAATLTGELTSSYDADCAGAGGGTSSYPFTLTRM